MQDFESSLDQPWRGFIGQFHKVIIHDGVTTIGVGAFMSNQLTSVIIGNNVTTISGGAFIHNQLTSVVIPDSVTTIGDVAFRSNQLTSVDIGNNVTIIGGWAFEVNQLTNVIIPDSVTTIGVWAFFDNPNMTYATFVSNSPAVNPFTFPPNIRIYWYESTEGWYPAPAWAVSDGRTTLTQSNFRIKGFQPIPRIFITEVPVNCFL